MEKTPSSFRGRHLKFSHADTSPSFQTFFHSNDQLVPLQVPKKDLLKIARIHFILSFKYDNSYIQNQSKKDMSLKNHVFKRDNQIKCHESGESNINYLVSGGIGALIVVSLLVIGGIMGYITSDYSHEYQITLQLNYSDRNFSQDEKKRSVQQTVDIFEERIENLGMPSKIKQTAIDEIRVRVPVTKPKQIELDRLKSILTAAGVLEFYLQASERKRKQAGQKGAGAEAPEGTKWIKADSNLSKKWYLVEEKPRIRGEHIQYVEVESDGDKYQINVNMNDKGAELFAEATRDANPDSSNTRAIAIAFDGIVQSAPVPRAVITEGRAVITGEFDADTAHRFATILNSGRIGVPVRIISSDIKKLNNH